MNYDLIGRLLLSLPAEDAEDARMAALADKISTYFTPNQNLLYRGVAGIGRHGGAIIFLDKRRQPPRRIVVKYSLSDEADWDLRNEARCLELLRGAEHIGQIIPLAEANLNVSGTGKRPTLALDYIPYVVRQVLAMAFPPEGGPDEPLRQEVFHPHMPLGLMQNSAHGNNVIIGDLTSDLEHSIVPVFKLIDFGRGEIIPDVQSAVENNIRNIGIFFIIVAIPRTGRDYLNEVPNGGWQYQFVNRETGVLQQIGTEAPPHFTEYKYIDLELRDLVARCMAIRRGDGVSLEELIHAAERGVAKTHEDIIYEDNTSDNSAGIKYIEMDESLRIMVQRFIFDAGTIQEEAATFDRHTVNDHLGTTLLGLNATTRPGRAPRPRFQQSGQEQDTVVDDGIDEN
ncbi:hypothetical protein F5Y00DRAFT_265557 [Daldinia vernicosa]|uniref:uncharacterized protein n=1 Tax=Daldinia vernicosa TaxID=114800 RepID=UPI002007779A|nr:uncharacterized protein F5Y00DRAFT_265557 [Daldinia vernicosa]KAI0845462.1 hypothetical protein F5Y00DRAFT_265557 [Daldinia vernicosa]